ncbi:MAG: gluconate 2-dehydrogenase subunit 3 family protein [Flavisolibacter sp.]|jgi:gluconate 2-dehydrogenase gamma chain|nr:gluconate 2-dehydrogenase subunit 3 family protein [Flavisolibacter sp.]
MDRRKYLKVLGLTTVSGSLLLDACKNADVKPADKAVTPDAGAVSYDRTEEEKQVLKKLAGDTFFTPHEMATIALLSDIIIPADEVSGSATQAKVPDFIEFIVKDKPEFQIPMQGGLRWLDIQMSKLYGTSFKDSSKQQQLAMVDAIAYPAKAKPGMQQGVSFFNLMRNLTATGFFSSEMGIKDMGYAGNKPNQWNGVPDDVLKQYGLSYSDKELKECVKFS